MSKKHRRSKKTKSKKAFQLKLKPATLYSIAQVFFYVLAGLTVLSFWRRGLVLIYINDWIVNLFSWTAIFLPFIFITFGLLISKLRLPITQPNVMVGALLFFVSLMSFSKAGIIGQSFFDGLFSTHPPVKERVRRLRSMRF